MNEVLTKSFWQSVKKTFYEALEPPPAEAQATQSPAGNPEEPSTEGPSTAESSTRSTPAPDSSDPR